MNALDVKSKEEWEALMKEIAEKTRLTVTLGDGKGSHILTTDSWTRCSLCARIREKKEAITFICSQTNTAMIEEAKRVKGPVVDFCDAGLIRMAVPIFRDGEVIGQLTACGAVVPDEEVDAFLVAQQAGITEEEAEVLAGEAPVVSMEEIQKLADECFAEFNP